MKKVEKDKTAILSEDELDKVSGGKFDEREAWSQSRV